MPAAGGGASWLRCPPFREEMLQPHCDMGRFQKGCTRVERHTQPWPPSFKAATPPPPPPPPARRAHEVLEGLELLVGHERRQVQGREPGLRWARAAILDCYRLSCTGIPRRLQP